MAETIKAMWLINDSQDKIAPKTLSSQVMMADGTSFETKIESDISTAKEEAITSALDSIAEISSSDVNSLFA